MVAGSCGFTNKVYLRQRELSPLEPRITLTGDTLAAIVSRIMKKINFLYWNIGNKQPPFEFEIKKLINSHEVDVLILVENKNINNDLIKRALSFDAVSLNANNKFAKWVNVYYKLNDEYKIAHHSEYTEIDHDSLPPKQVNRVQVFKIIGKSSLEIFFSCVHFPSELYHDEISHLQIAPNYKEKIHSLTNNSSKAFIVGDFNMNPFDLGMVEPMGFYAFNNRELVTDDQKLKYGSRRALYYNPCWTLLGDYISKSNYVESKRSGGSFYYGKRASRNIYWHLIDQIIIRKSIIDNFIESELEVIETPEISKFLYSTTKILNEIDHFPLKFSFNFEL